MPPTSHLLAFALISFALIIVPGPNVIFVVTRSLMLGRAAGVGTAMGGVAGEYVQVIAVALGIGALVERSVALFTVIKLAGAAYLVYLGVQGIRHRRSLRNALNQAAEPKGIARIVRDGIVVGVSNPKAIVFFAAVRGPAGRRCPGADAAARGDVRGHRGAVRQLMGAGRGDGQGLVRAVAAAAGTGRRDRWPGDDRDRRRPGRHRAPRLTGRAGARDPFGLRAP